MGWAHCLWGGGANAGCRAAYKPVPGTASPHVGGGESTLREDAMGISPGAGRELRDGDVLAAERPLDVCHFAVEAFKPGVTGGGRDDLAAAGSIWLPASLWHPTPHTARQMTRRWRGGANWHAAGGRADADGMRVLYLKRQTRKKKRGPTSGGRRGENSRRSAWLQQAERRYQGAGFGHAGRGMEKVLVQGMGVVIREEPVGGGGDGVVSGARRRPVEARMGNWDGKRARR